VPHGKGALISRKVEGQACAEAPVAVLLRNIAVRNSLGAVWLRNNALPVLVSGVLCNLLFRISSLVWLQPPTCSYSMSVSMFFSPFLGGHCCRRESRWLKNPLFFRDNYVPVSGVTELEVSFASASGLLES
jgi:hypothetical protein